MSTCSISELSDTPTQPGLRRELSTCNFQSANKRTRAEQATAVVEDDEPLLQPSLGVETPSTPVVPRLTRSAAFRLLANTPVTPSLQPAPGTNCLLYHFAFFRVFYFKRCQYELTKEVQEVHVEENEQAEELDQDESEIVNEDGDNHEEVEVDGESTQSEAESANSSDDEEEKFNVDAMQQERLGTFDHKLLNYFCRSSG